MLIRDKRKRAFYKWAYSGYVTQFEERLLQRWWNASGRSKLRNTGEAKQ